jgi:hypothetical protein
VTKEHPQNHRCTAGGELFTASGHGLYFDTHLSQERGTEGHPRGSGGGNDFFTGDDLSVQLVELTRRSVGTSCVPTAPPRGCR